MTNSDQRRPIRSYVLRTGRMTPGQQRAYSENWQRWGLEHADGPVDLQTVFGRPAESVLEIGFGMGQSLVEMASAAPQTNFVGIEVHRPGVGRLLHCLQEDGVDNVRVYCHDAVEVLRDCIGDETLDVIQVYFPDPWHKKRHHKRRLIQPQFVEQLRAKLRKGGRLHLATDWEHYAVQMIEVLEAAPGLGNPYGEAQFAPRPDYRPLTKFELRGERLGHGVWDIIYLRE